MTDCERLTADISIHAAREGGDELDRQSHDGIYISIHAAREGGDLPIFYNNHSYYIISIHAAREGGDGFGRSQRAGVKISIHAAREGGDKGKINLAPEGTVFQSTPPVKAATVSVAVSVPVLRFQSTPPVKAATVAGQVPADYTLFQSTPPVKAATCSSYDRRCMLTISIHAAREGSDVV